MLPKACHKTHEAEKLQGILIKLHTTELLRDEMRRLCSHSEHQMTGHQFA